MNSTKVYSRSNMSTNHTEKKGTPKSEEDDDIKEVPIDIQTIKSISNLIEDIISESKDLNTNGDNIKISSDYLLKNPFTVKKPPTVSLEAYLQRIIKYTKIELSTLVITLIYLDRICEINNFHLNKNNIHR
jgi:hypothetical protein